MPNPEQIKPVQVLRGLPPEQNVKASPVVIAPHLPAMEKLGEVKTVQRNPLLPLMGAGAPRHTGGEGLMAPVPSQIAVHSPHTENPQQPKEGQVASASQDGYVRAKVRLENGQLSVIELKQVLGPLGMPSGITRGYVYEVLLGEQQVALGSLPDLGVRRSFANRDVPGPEGKHHFAKLSTIEFFIRIPKNYVSSVNLPKLSIVLHDVRDAPHRLMSLAPLQKQSGVSTVEVARLVRISLEQLSPTVRPHLEEILKETDKAQ
jgi:hypothetical protein